MYGIISVKEGGRMKLDYIKILDGAKEFHGGNQSNFGKNAARSGCGMIAACDMLLFLTGRRSLSAEEYRRFVESACSSFFYRYNLNLFGVTARRIVKYLGEKGFMFRFVPKRKLKGAVLEQYISESLDSGIPVIARIGLNQKKLHYKITYPVSGKYSQGSMSWHYITLTGLEKDTVFFSSWGGKGEMLLSDLQLYMGIMGGIIVPDRIFEQSV